MVFSAEDRSLIKGLRQEKGYVAKRLILEFPNKPWTLSGLKKLLRKIGTNGTVERKLGSGRKWTVRTNENIRLIEELVLSQDDQPGTHQYCLIFFSNTFYYNSYMAAPFAIVDTSFFKCSH